jgi:hypothetical protein
MTATKNLIGTSLILIATCVFASCGHDNGSAGTTNGTNEESFYFNDSENLAAPMDSVNDTGKTAPAQAESAKPTAADSTK